MHVPVERTIFPRVVKGKVRRDMTRTGMCRIKFQWCSEYPASESTGRCPVVVHLVGVQVRELVDTRPCVVDSCLLFSPPTQRSP